MEVMEPFEKRRYVDQVIDSDKVDRRVVESLRRQLENRHADPSNRRLFVSVLELLCGEPNASEEYLAPFIRHALRFDDYEPGKYLNDHSYIRFLMPIRDRELRESLVRGLSRCSQIGWLFNLKVSELANEFPHLAHDLLRKRTAA